ncbi:tRNA guanosine(15) transglycosylase TgtA, partial [Candidatus Thorarchaeota archaeon]
EMMLAGTVQGGIFEDLREQSAQAMGTLDFDVYPIGGVVPLMEMYRYADIVRVTLAAKKHLPPDRPVHLFGCGHPMLFAQAALLGCDFFDSASYAKFAEKGRMLLTTGTVHLNELTELPCECPICSKTTPEELMALPKDEKDLALMCHNLYVSAAEMRRVRQAIADGKLFELAALRARSHPALLEALQVMSKNMDQLVESDPFGKSSSIFYTGAETAVRPEISRFHDRILERYPFRTTGTLVIVPDIGERPFSDTASTIIAEVRTRTPEDTILLFFTPMGTVPWELEHVHPAQQCIFSKDVDPQTLGIAKSRLLEILAMISFNKIVWFERESPTNQFSKDVESIYKMIRTTSASETINALESSKSESSEWHLRKLRALLMYQWGSNTGNIANIEGLQVVFSRSTGKIRHVTLKNEIIFTVVPTTGLLTPTFAGGEILLQHNIDDRFIITMEKDAGEFVAKGKSALAKFVIDAKSNLTAGEEVLVVDEEQQLLGTGRALLSGSEMLAFNRGVAVVIRHSPQR